MPAPVAEPVRNGALVTLAANTAVAFVVAWFTQNGWDLDPAWVGVITAAAVGVANFILGALLWGWGKFSEKIPWETVRDRVTPL